VARMGERRGAYRFLVGRPEGKRPLGRRKRRWEDSIRMDLREIGIDGAIWFQLAQDADAVAKRKIRICRNKLCRSSYVTFIPHKSVLWLLN
jgi:hypothetical protein